MQARALLGQVQYRLGDRLLALRTYERLVAMTPDDRDARATLERWQREAELHDRMQQTVGSHFTVSFEGPAESALAAEALEALDRAYWRVGQMLGTYPSEPIAVVLYTGEQFRDITRAPSWAAGAYDGVIRVPMRGALDQRQELDRVLSHEFTHALIRTLASRGVPAWLNEGLATALKPGPRMSRPTRPPRRCRRCRCARCRPASAASPARRRSSPMTTSALAARRLLDEAGGFAIANLLRDLGEGVDFDAAFLHRIQRPFAEFQSRDDH